LEPSQRDVAENIVSTPKFEEQNGGNKGPHLESRLEEYYRKVDMAG
jgi:hypothetical protein